MRQDDSPRFSPALLLCPHCAQHTNQTISLKPVRANRVFSRRLLKPSLLKGSENQNPKIGLQGPCSLLTFRPVFAWLLLPHWPLLFPERDWCSHEGLCVWAWFPHSHNVHLFYPSHFFTSFHLFPPINAKTGEHRQASWPDTPSLQASPFECFSTLLIIPKGQKASISILFVSDTSPSQLLGSFNREGMPSN